MAERTQGPCVGAAPRRRHSQSGETLVESLVALTVITVVGLAAFAGLWAAVNAGIGHDSSARGESLLRSSAEWLQSPDTPYITRAGCSGTGTYSLPAAITSDQPGVAVAVTGVEFWSNPPPATQASLPTAATVDFATTCPSTDQGLQRVTLTATGPTTADTLVVVKRRP